MEEKCKKCADIWCRFSKTKLSEIKNPFKDFVVFTCKKSEHDYQIPYRIGEINV